MQARSYKYPGWISDSQGCDKCVVVCFCLSLCVFVQFSPCEFMGNVGVHHTIDRGLANVGVILKP